MQRFWMIIGEGSPSTSVRHFDKEEARSEVERLVKKENKLFYLLEVIEAGEPKEIDVMWRYFSDI